MTLKITLSEKVLNKHENFSDEERKEFIAFNYRL